MYHHAIVAGDVECSESFAGRCETATAGVEVFFRPDGLMNGNMFLVATEIDKGGEMARHISRCVRCPALSFLAHSRSLLTIHVHVCSRTPCRLRGFYRV